MQKFIAEKKTITHCNNPELNSQSQLNLVSFNATMEYMFSFTKQNAYFNDDLYQEYQEAFRTVLNDNL